MLILTEDLDQKSVWGLWKIEEDPKWLYSNLKLNLSDQRTFDKITHPQKKLEWMAGRNTIRKLVQLSGKEYHGIYKDEHGKPHLRNHDSFVSISHCYPYAAAIVSKSSSIAIDIEFPKEKLTQLASKFLSDIELEMYSGNLTRLCYAWSAKETLYKLYGKRKVIFKTDLLIKSINKDVIEATFTKNSPHLEYDLIARKWEDLLITLNTKEGRPVRAV